MQRRYAPLRLTNKRELLFADKLCLSPRGNPGHKLTGVVTPEVRQMRYFSAVAEYGSFTGAARQLHVTQQAVSQQVKALERLLGVTLLERSSRRVKLTSEGLVFLADCRRVLAGADRAARRVQAAARGEAGTLRLVYTLVSAFETVPVLLARLEKDYPLLKVDAREVFGSDVSNTLARWRLRSRARAVDVVRLALLHMIGRENSSTSSSAAQPSGASSARGKMLLRLRGGTA
jgi:molybdenum-dependent DNA-binding transcriptional regulator ModE